ncbi:hypothetical protein J2S13_003141 [Oikeobacillus pervagus]|uniref:Uncharacterized protein n=1 Tax=Oikeobacillus pervagus TaxID=1325931 RepID=A0AAJ1T4L7_9BACI|nr:hypothetical protein [Oikeobacillus pervagus]MDQ0216667.1 hypothetical protein [Oikeobacillus pervagus]
MILREGITGFHDAKSEQIPIVDQKQFKQLCFSVLFRIEGTVVEIKDQCCHGNFIDVEVSLQGTKLHILLNKYYPIVAFASYVDFDNITFIDEPKLSEEFCSSYQVLSCRDLNKPVSLKLGAKTCLLNENELNQAELKQVAYWKPRTIGEIVFNQWD